MHNTATSTIDPFIRLAGSIKVSDVLEPVRILDSAPGQSTRDPLQLIQMIAGDRNSTDFWRPVLIIDSARTNVGELVSHIPVTVFFPRRLAGRLLQAGKDNPHGDIVHEFRTAADAAMVQIGSGSFISSDTTLLRLLSTASFNDDNDFFVVLHELDWVGIITRSVLRHSLTKLCFMAIVFDLEETALRLIKLTEKECFRTLPVERQRKAFETMLHKRAHGGGERSSGTAIQLTFADLEADSLDERHYSELLDATTFIDRGTMIRKARLTIELPNKQIERVFRRAERIRNDLAHPTDADYHYKPREFRDILLEVRQATQVISETHDRELRVRMKSSQQPIDVSSEQEDEEEEE